MPFTKGKPKTGGRKLGITNKRKPVQQLCDESGIDPFVMMIEIARNSDDDHLRFSALKELCQYLEPKKKAIEHSGEISNPYANKTLEELKELGQKKLAE